MPASDSGKLVLAANSLGRPEDIPARSLAYLRTAELLLFEDLRGGRQALKAAGIHRDFLKYSEHAETQALEQAAAVLKRGGTVIYMSDQGMPVLADPGQGLLRLAASLGAKVEVVPGPSSVTTALAACPFYSGPFFFQGFLARDGDERAAEITNLAERDCPTVILETPYRRQALCEACADILPAARRAFLAIDITGADEAYITTTCGELGKVSSQIAGKLNFVLVIAGKE